VRPLHIPSDTKAKCENVINFRDAQRLYLYGGQAAGANAKRVDPRARFMKSYFTKESQLLVSAKLAKIAF
jgi:hypothetical protein